MNSGLPLHVTPATVQQNPEFVKLLMALTRQLTDSGMSVTVHKDMMQVHKYRSIIIIIIIIIIIVIIIFTSKSLKTCLQKGFVEVNCVTVCGH